MKNPPGLIHISTGGSAGTTSITIDGVSPLVKRACIEIDPTLGENKITLECYSQQKNKMYEDGETQVYCGISQNNFEFFKQLFTLIANTSDFDLDQELSSGKLSPDVYTLLKFIYDARHQGPKTDAQAPEQS